MPDNVINRLQKLQNIASRTLTKNTKQCHITPILKLPHWLPVKFRIRFKIPVFQACHGVSLIYLCELIKKHSTLYSEI